MIDCNPAKCVTSGNEQFLCYVIWLCKYIFLPIIILTIGWTFYKLLENSLRTQSHQKLNSAK